MYLLLIEINTMLHDPMHKKLSQKAGDLHEKRG